MRLRTSPETWIGALAGQSSEATESICRLVDNITRNIEEINSKADICIKDMEICMSGVDRVSDFAAGETEIVRQTV